MVLLSFGAFLVIFQTLLFRVLGRLDYFGYEAIMPQLIQCLKDKEGVTHQV